MCGRSTITKSEGIIEQRFGATFAYNPGEIGFPLPTYNGAPGQLLPVILDEKKEQIHALQWGLIPVWAKDNKIGYKTINARLETLTEKPSFKKLVTTRRCIVIMDGYYEWQLLGIGKQAYRITLPDEGLFAVAGLWDVWVDPQTGNTTVSFTVITKAAGNGVEHLHDRMPIILDPNHESIWLRQDLSRADVTDLLHETTTTPLVGYAVSAAVGKVSNNSRSLIEKIDKPQGMQGTLF